MAAGPLQLAERSSEHAEGQQGTLQAGGGNCGHAQFFQHGIFVELADDGERLILDAIQQ